MDKLLVLLLAITVIGTMGFAYPDSLTAILLGAVCSVIALILINKNFQGDEKIFIRRIFVIGLMLRMVLATITYVFELQGFFGGDSITYDYAGFALYSDWFGYDQAIQDVFFKNTVAQAQGSGWGMAYIVAGIYTFTGRNPFATQLFNCVIGAATACLIYKYSKQIFNNTRVGKVAAALIAVFPSLIIWTSQGLKDGIICFLLVLAMNSVSSLQKKFSYVNISILMIALMGIYSLRFYLFFALSVAIFGSFFIKAGQSGKKLIQQFAVLILITLGLTYFGVLNNAQKNLETYGNLETLQNSRLDQARSAESGFGQDIDVSTTEGAIQALPIGLAYIMLAPFPWQVSNFRQAITVPEVLAWWVLIPFMFFGIWYAVKNKFKESMAVLMFTSLLTVSYALFQGNVGTAYRMRAQMLIFYFIFVAVGLVLWKEKRENLVIMNKQNKRR